MIHAEGLGKRYRLGERLRYRMLREVIMTSLGSVLGRNRRKTEFLWALRNVSFDVRKGEVVGIIGRNGAGKSTLLKILSRITEPTEGFAEIYGRLGSLLEVGTGFHQELTGRDNVYLSGAILGMKKRDITQKFDEIVSFAEVEKFIDTPLKRYSSGMQVRLGFAVAAFLEPDILLVDEVLAVGDSAFQKKCLGKLGEVTEEGRTVLFVSHNLRSITELCQRCLWINDGQIVEEGVSERVVLDYLSSFQPQHAGGEITSSMHGEGTGDVYFTGVSLLNEKRETVSSIFFGEPIRISLEFEVRRPVENMRLVVAIERLRDGTLVTALHNTDALGLHPINAEPGKYSAIVESNAGLMPGGYTIHIAAKAAPGYWGHGRNWDLVNRALNFYVDEFSSSGGSVLPSGGIMRPASKWDVHRADALE